jgi:hypothetical protein
MYNTIKPKLIAITYLKLTAPNRRLNRITEILWTPKNTCAHFAMTGLRMANFTVCLSIVILKALLDGLTCTLGQLYLSRNKLVLRYEVS